MSRRIVAAQYPYVPQTLGRVPSSTRVLYPGTVQPPHDGTVTYQKCVHRYRTGDPRKYPEAQTIGYVAKCNCAACVCI